MKPYNIYQSILPVIPYICMFTPSIGMARSIFFCYTLKALGFEMKRRI